MAFRAQKVFGTIEKRAPKRESNPDLCDVSGVLNQVICQANWELVVTCVNDNPVDSG